MNEATMEKTISTGGSDAHIAVAIRSMFGDCTAMFSTAFVHALEAGFSRHYVSISQHGALFRPGFCVNTVTVSWNARAEAIQSIKATLKELGLLESGAAVIALETADCVWNVVHGNTTGGQAFEQEFFKPEDLAACKAEVERLKALIELVNTINGRNSGQNPESK